MSRAERAPCDPVACRVQARERAAQAGDVRQHVFLGHEHFIEHDLAGDRRAQADLAVDRRRAQALPAFLEHKAADVAVIILRPNDEDVGDR